MLFDEIQMLSMFDMMKEGERRKGRDTWLYKNDKPTEVFVLNIISTKMFNAHTQCC